MRDGEITDPLSARDFESYHCNHLPREIAGRSRLVQRDLRNRQPLAIRLPDGASFTYTPVDGTVTIEAGDSRAATVVELAPDAWQELVAEIRTVPGLIYSDKVRCVRGDVMDFLHWEPSLRGLWHGRPIFDADGVDLRDLDGKPLNLGQTFSLDDAMITMRHFLEEAGYLVVRDVFSAAEVHGLKNETERLRAATRRDDRRSWWATNAADESLLCRITYAGERSQAFARLFDDERVRRLVAISGRDLLAAADRLEGVTVLFKNPGMVSGLSDLPWHRDCGLGGHSIMCPLLIVGIHLDAMNSASGELRVLPGSWKASCHFMEATDPNAPIGVGLSANPGDCTLHYGDLMHAAPPPTGTGSMRTTLYLGFMPEDAFRFIGPAQAYNDILLSDGSGRVRHMVEKIRA